MSADPGDRLMALREHFVWLFATGAALGVFSALRFYAVTWLGERVSADLRTAVYSHVLRQSPEFFETTQTGEVISRITTDTTVIQGIVGSGLSMGLRNVIMGLGAVALLIFSNPWVMAQVLGILVLVVAPAMFFGRRVRRLSRSSQDRIADASAIAAEMLNAITVVQSHAAGGARGRALRRRQRGRLRHRAQADQGALLPRRVHHHGDLRRAAVGAVPGHAGGDGGQDLRGSPGADGGLRDPAGVIGGGAGGGLGRPAARGGRDGAADGAARGAIAGGGPGGAGRLPASTGPARVAFEQVRFHYPSRPDRAALEDFTLRIEPGETVALVGPSGAGKSTVLQLLQRFFDVQSGKLQLDGVPVDRVKLADLRGRMALVPQQSVIFSASALDNIRYGRPDASAEEVIAAAKAAHADEFIRQLPQGYDSFLGERGVRLSGGQRQRIAIARAMLQDAPLLLLDEATGALDAESERLVQAGAGRGDA